MTHKVKYIWIELHKKHLSCFLYYFFQKGNKRRFDIMSHFWKTDLPLPHYWRLIPVYLWINVTNNTLVMLTKQALGWNMRKSQMRGQVKYIENVKLFLCLENVIVRISQNIIQWLRNVMVAKKSLHSVCGTLLASFNQFH